MRWDFLKNTNGKAPPEKQVMTSQKLIGIAREIHNAVNTVASNKLVMSKMELAMSVKMEEAELEQTIRNFEKHASFKVNSSSRNDDIVDIKMEFTTKTEDL